MASSQQQPLVDASDWGLSLKMFFLFPLEPSARRLGVSKIWVRIKTKTYICYNKICLYSMMLACLIITTQNMQFKSISPMYHFSLMFPICVSSETDDMVGVFGFPLQQLWGLYFQLNICVFPNYKQEAYLWKFERINML